MITVASVAAAHGVSVAAVEHAVFQVTSGLWERLHKVISDEEALQNVALVLATMAAKAELALEARP